MQKRMPAFQSQGSQRGICGHRALLPERKEKIKKLRGFTSLAQGHRVVKTKPGPRVVPPAVGSTERNLSFGTTHTNMESIAVRGRGHAPSEGTDTAQWTGGLPVPTYHCAGES